MWIHGEKIDYIIFIPVCVLIVLLASWLCVCCHKGQFWPRCGFCSNRNKQRRRSLNSSSLDYSHSHRAMDNFDNIDGNNRQNDICSSPTEESANNGEFVETKVVISSDPGCSYYYTMRTISRTESSFIYDDAQKSLIAQQHEPNTTPYHSYLHEAAESGTVMLNDVSKNNDDHSHNENNMDDNNVANVNHFDLGVESTGQTIIQ